jgi:hypothetical protein
MTNDRSLRLARRLLTLAAGATLALTAAACGNVTAGGFTEVRVDVSGNATDPSPLSTLLEAATAPSAATASDPLPSSHGDAEEAEGEVEIDVRLALVSETGGVVPLGRDDIRIKLDLRGVNEAEAVSELVPSGRYTGLRMAFVHIQVEVEGGLIVGDQEITGTVSVHLEDPELVLVRPIDIEAVEGGTVALLVDLNTPAWLAAVDPDTRTVDASVFAARIDVVVR